MTLSKILIEGSDGSGKSTLAKLIEDKLDGNTFFAHWTAPPKGLSLRDKKEYMDDVHEIGLELAAWLRNHVIYDRFHISDLVYLPLFSDGTNQHSWVVDKEMATLGFKMVLCMADPKELERRVNERGDWLITPNQVASIQAKYVDVIQDTKMPYFIYKTDLTSISEMEIQDQLLFRFLNLKGEE